MEIRETTENGQDAARMAADAFIECTYGLTLEQVKRTVEYIATDLARAREDAREIAEEMRATRRLLESEG